MDKKYLSKIVHGSDTLYIKDSEAREAISALEAYSDYLGVTTTALTDGATTNPITINSESVTAKKGNIANYGSKEFIFNGTAWQEFGDLSALGSLAYKNSAEGSVTAAGTNAASAVSFSGTTDSNFVTGYNDDGVAPSKAADTFAAGSLPSFTEGAFTPASLGTGFYTAGSAPSFSEGAFTPASLGTGFYTAGSAATYSHSGFSGGSLGEATTSNFATEGIKATYTENNETLTFSDASKSSAVTAQGTFTAAVYGTDTFNGGTPTAIDVTKFNGGSKAADTFSAGSVTTIDTTKFSGGSKASDTFSAGSLPSFTEGAFSAGSPATLATSKAITGLGTATAAAQTFTGSSVSVTVS